ncbi:hypothetical protein UC34_11565 [Pandoraea vervacti]|uniref:Uncharacterized protein n=1 Tax=Pandoraea vervacti TaxID=656178 RepID=A0ABM5SYE6_9BURK|nr:hypothetical protein [Pandoraea vervacti]AJP57488.1 hypothetical protein UC34_11565 [Pandoraea vervacti]
MTKSLTRLTGATSALALLCCFWMAASAHAASPTATANHSGVSATKSITASSTQGARPSRAARVRRAARASAYSPPGSPPPALVGAAPAPWHDVFAQAGAWAPDPVIVSGRTLSGTLGNAGLTDGVEGLVTGPRAGLTGLYQTVWHRALTNPALSTQLFAGAPEYFGLHF